MFLFIRINFDPKFVVLAYEQNYSKITKKKTDSSALISSIQSLEDRKGNMQMSLSSFFDFPECFLFSNFPSTLQRVPNNMFKNMVPLKYLNLEQNHMEVLNNESFRGQEGSLETLIISKNKLYDIRGSPFRGFFKLKRLFIDLNDMYFFFIRNPFFGLALIFLFFLQFMLKNVH